MDWTYLSDIMKTLGHPVRLRLVAHLSDGDDHVGAMAAALRVRPAVVSQQLSILRMRGLVSKTQVSGRAVYTLEEPRLRDLLGCVVGCRRPVQDAPPPLAGGRSFADSWTPAGGPAVSLGEES